MSRPDMRFVPIKSAEQQAVLMMHKTRELLVTQRTMSVHALRGHLAEFGRVVAKCVSRIGQLLELADNDGSLPEEAKEMAKLLASHLEGLDRSIDAAEKKIAAANRRSQTGQLLDAVPGQRDVMNDMAVTERQGHPARRHEPKLAAMIRDQGRRTSSGPPATAPHQKAGHITEADQNVQCVK